MAIPLQMVPTHESHDANGNISGRDTDFIQSAVSDGTFAGSLSIQLILPNYLPMSCSKPLPPFVCDSLNYLNRDQLERFTIVCRHLKNFIERYFQTKPCRIFDELTIHEGSYALRHNEVQWHPNRVDYSVQEFLAGQKCNIDELKDPRFSENLEFYSFTEMRLYLIPTVRIKQTIIGIVPGDSTYNSEHIAQMESIAHLWRNYAISIQFRTTLWPRVGAEDFQLILNSPTILQCRNLQLVNAYFSFKDYEVLYTVNDIEIFLLNGKDEINPNYLPDFLEQPRVKPIVFLERFHHKVIVNLLDRLSKAFSSAVVPNAFKINFVQEKKPLTEFRETNLTSGEKLELKKELPTEYQKENYEKYGLKWVHYTLERSTI